MNFFSIRRFREAARPAAARRDVFASVAGARLVEKPYPHLVVENALPQDLIDILLAEMPAIDVFTRGTPRGSNVRFAPPSAVVLADPQPSPAWKAALRECNANLASLLAHFVNRFGRHITEAYPDFSARFAPIEGLRAVPRANAPWRADEIGMDAQMVINTPALTGGTSVRGPHLDVPDKLISGLLYLRAPDDDLTGGELQLFEQTAEPLTFRKHEVTSLDRVRVVQTYPNRHNLMILPLSTAAALHGVSPRSATAWPRYHLHLVGQMSAPLFAIPG